MLERSSLIQLLLSRLERISVDSPLAHRASGVRGALLRSLDEETAGLAVDPEEIDRNVDAALGLLCQAAAELRTSHQNPGL
jgi:hypothetical protein